jgi:hypothetical protein
VILLEWQSPIRTFSQIWQYSKYESRKSLSTLHIVGNYDFFHKFLIPKIPKKGNLGTKKISKKIHKMAKSFHK